MTEPVTFEDNLKKLQQVVNLLESGDVPLDKAMEKFKNGIAISNQLQSKLNASKSTVAKVMSNGQEVPYDRDRNGQDINNDVNNTDENNSNPFGLK